MKTLNLTQTKKERNLERIKLINEGYLFDSSYHLDILLEKMNPKPAVKVHENLYTIRRA